jgi:NADH:ubiquinone oxidoreductase subunit 4 (subunit M)|tara:strand:+ start:941 stop:1189 length:249 start_codon:yes stop_codon:yes gene_type:complete
MNINLILGIDGISLFFILLTTLLVPLCLLGSWVGIKTNVKEYFIAFLAIEAILIAVFSILDLILFYVFFERVLIPIFLIIGF